MKVISLLGSITLAALFLTFSATASATVGPVTTLPDGTQQMTYSIPLENVTSGQNKIRYRTVNNGTEKPAVDGFITKIVPDLVYTSNGTTPSSSKVMFHHGVWINVSNGNLFFATGEEKTQLDMPPGYGYQYRADHNWMLNEMIHNLTPQPMDLSVTYRIDFIPKTAPAAAAIKPARPIWMDVETSLYPVFDVLRDSGGADGEFTYPQDAGDPYGGAKHNENTIPSDGVLLGTTGHVHTGGLSTDLYLKRAGAAYGGSICEKPPTYFNKLNRMQRQLNKMSRMQKKAKKKSNQAWMKKLKRQKKAKSKARRKLKSKAGAADRAYEACLDTQPAVEGDRVHLFESVANYFEPAGPVSWDMAMTSTEDDWRVQVKAGDTLELQTTYETERASWYESMGINIVYWAPNETNGRNPYVTKVDTPGVLNHGHYPENDDHGGVGGDSAVGPDPTKLPDGLLSSGPFDIGDYAYEAGNFRLPGAAGRPPVIEKGKSFTFNLTAEDASKEIWHSLTSCKAPCNKSTGIAYPIADGEFQFDSGQLGVGGAPTVNRTTWSTPANLPVGTHTYFCRIHPLMRGAFRVKPKS